MIKAQVLLTRNPDTSPVIALSAKDSIMDVTGQPAENIPTNPDLVVWELWTQDLVPYEKQSGIIILSSKTIDDETGTEIKGKPIDFIGLRSYMKKVMIAAKVDSAIGAELGDRDGVEISNDLKAWAKVLPKVKEVIK